MYIDEEPGDPQPEQPAQPFIEDQVAELVDRFAELTGRFADMMKVVDYLAATKTLPKAEAAANQRLHDFLKRSHHDGKRTRHHRIARRTH